MKLQTFSRNLLRGGLAAAASLLALSLMPARSLAFDTGHHWDLTISALGDQGFDNDAREIGGVSNWFVDYYVNTPTDIAGMKEPCERLHFDNLFDTDDITAYWLRLAANTRKQLLLAKASQDPLKALEILGASLHAVQDFYTHSNWVEEQGGKTRNTASDGYLLNTWFDEESAGRIAAKQYYTGSYPTMRNGAKELHGAYDAGLNHDSYCRPRWDQAYVFAYAASRQWIAAAESWLNAPAFWTQMKSYAAGGGRAGLDSDIRASWRVSEWVATGPNDGHWKGKGSGRNAAFLAENLRWAGSDSTFVKKFKGNGDNAQAIPTLLAPDLGFSDGPKPQAPGAGDVAPVPPLAITGSAIVLHTDQVNFGEKADLYPLVNIGGQEFVDAMREVNKSISISDERWTAIKFVPTGAVSVPIGYSLWKETGIGADEVCDVNPQTGKQAAAVSVPVQAGPATAHNFSGKAPDARPADVKFTVQVRSLKKNP